MALEKIRLKDMTEIQSGDLTPDDYLLIDNEEEVVKIKLAALVEYIAANLP